MIKITRLGALLLLIALSDFAMARPRTKEVKLITEPRPGEEYVMFQSGQTRVQSKTQPRVLEAQHGPEFATSHRIPQRDRAIVEKEILDIPRGPRDKVKRDSPSDIELSHMFAEVLLTPGATLPLVEESAPPSASEVRTEFSVVTSVPRKVVANEPGVKVEVEPKGGSGILEARLEGADEKKIMVKKTAIIEQKLEDVVKREQDKKKEDELLATVEVMPIASVGVTSPKFESHQGDISVPLQKKLAVVNTNTQANADVTTTVRPLTSTAPVSKSPFDIIPVNVLADKGKEPLVDTPLGDKVLVPAGSAANPQSRIEVKKGPNGQDYEYEYVYYYYDDEDNETVSTANEKPTDSNLALPSKEDKSTTTTTTTTTPSPTTTTTTEKATTPIRRFAPREKESSEESHTSARGRARARGQTSRGGETPAPAEEAVPSKQTSTGSRHRYTTIERSTVAPESANEVIPSRSGGRFRGRTLSHGAEDVPEERLPSSTRFPTRTTTQAAADETPVTRARASGNSAASATNSVRRPSLELVDSRSFRTYSSDASPDQDLSPDSPAFPSVLPAGPVRFLGVTPNEESSEREVSRPRIRSRGHSTTSTTTAAEEVSESEPTRRRRPSTTPLPALEDISVEEDYSTATAAPIASRSRPLVTTDVTDSTDTDPTETTDLPTTVEDIGLTAAMMDKAAFDLYAILQQTQAENASNFIDENATELSTDEELTTEEDASTTDVPATTTVTTTTTTTTTTTPAPTTTTTTEPPTTASGRRGNKKRPGSPGAAPGRNRYRANGSTAAATSTTEAPAETSSARPRGRFGSNRNGASGGNTFGSRRAGHKKTPSHDEESGEKEAVKEEVKEVSAPKPGFSRRFSGTRGTRVTTTTAAPSEDNASGSTSTVTRPALPADRFSLRRRTGVTRPGTHPTTAAAASTAAPVNEEHKTDNGSEEGGESSSETSSTAATSRPLRGGRPAIGGGPRPLRPGPRINIASRGRLGPSTTTTAAPPTEVEADSKEEQSSPATSEEKETQPENQESQDPVTTTPVPALTRLRNRPRLHVTAAAKPTPSAAAAAASSNRRALVSPLLSRRRPGAPAPAEPKEPEAEQHHDAEEESDSAEKQHSEEVKDPSTEVTPAPATTAAHEQSHDNKGLSSLIAGRRRPAARRPGALFPGNRSAAKEEAA